MKMAPSSAATALRESFGDRKIPDITRKITACVACRKLKVRLLLWCERDYSPKVLSTSSDQMSHERLETALYAVQEPWPPMYSQQKYPDAA